MATCFDAARGGQTSVIKAAVAAGESIQMQDGEGNTLLHFAILAGADLTAEYLVDTMENVNVPNAAGLTPLLAAILPGDDVASALYSRKADSVEYLIQSGKADLAFLDPEGRPALHRAIDLKSDGILDAILKAGAKAANSQNADGETALMVAVQRSEEQIVGRLLKCGADCGIVAASGQTALTLAVKNKQLAVVKAFAQQSADLNAPNRDGESPLIIAIKEDADDIVATLVNRRVKMNTGDNDGNTPLHWAVLTNKLKYVRRLINAPAVNLNVANARGITPLMLAVDNEWLEHVDALITGKADANLPDQEGNTALHRAAIKANLDILKKLMDNGGNEKQANKAGATPYELSKTKKVRELFKEYNIDIWQAARKSDVGTVKKLLQSGQDVEALDDDNSTALHVACEKGSTAVVTLLLDSNAKTDRVNNEGMTPLHCALNGADSSNDTKHEIVKLLLKKGTDPAIPDGKGWLPIHRAVALKSSNIVARLLERSSAFIEARNKDGMTPLQVAAEHGDAEVCGALLKAGANAQVPNDNGDTPLLVACLKNNPAVAKRLLEGGAEATTINKDGVTPLLAAMNHDNQDILSALLAAKCDVNHRDKAGNQPIHIAASKGHEKLVKQLIDAGAAVDSPTNEGFTPLMLAVDGKFDKVVDVLLQSKCNLDARDSAGNTALHRCARIGELDLLRKLLKLGANAEIYNNEGLSPAGTNDHPQILYLFEEFKLMNAPPSTADDALLIPCEFCNKMFTMEQIMPHQFNCTGAAS